MDFTSFNQLTEVTTGSLWLLLRVLLLIVGGLSAGSLLICIGGAIWQCVIETRADMRRRLPRLPEVRAALSTSAMSLAEPGLSAVSNIPNL